MTTYDSIFETKNYVFITSSKLNLVLYIENQEKLINHSHFG